MNFEYCTITTTTDDPTIAELITKALLESQLVACVQSSKIQSQYKWENKVVNTTEIMLHMKSKCVLYKNVETKIKALHNYEVPQIVMIPIINANQAYLKWIDAQVMH